MSAPVYDIQLTIPTLINFFATFMRILVKLH